MFEKTLAASILLCSTLFCSSDAFAQGPRPPAPPAGPGQPPAAAPALINGAVPIRGLNQTELAVFTEGVSRFTEVDSVSGTQPGAAGVGLGPRFNMNSCAGCHAHPTVGGSSPAINPQVAVATNFGATNTIPAFITQNGPVRAARFVRNPDGTPDGGVHDLFTITGRSDAPGCHIAQPDFAAAAAGNNLSLRIPTPLFGLGLMEGISESTILANKAANAQLKAQLGIGGHENRNGNDGTITRFGWKAQNKSLTIFAGEAYNVEQGVTNELFPNERDETPGCATNATPEDHTNITATSVLKSLSDISGITAFMKYLAPPPPSAAPSASIANGQQLFNQLGCALCHTPTLPTGNSSTAALSNQQVRIYSDLLVHNMGVGLADGVTQGDARGGDWRSAPLWGLGQRLFYLHDGRTSDLTQAIKVHASQGSEANAVINAFSALSASAQQDLINFLKSL